MKYYDLHTHTNMSDGSVPLEDLVKQETELGYGLGVTDHFFILGLYTMNDVQRYLEALAPYNVYRGAEINMEHNATLPDALDAQLDYVIASVHNIPDGRGGFIPLEEYFGKRSGAVSIYRKNYSSDMCKWYLAHTLRLMEKNFSEQRVDILGHATVSPTCDEMYGTRFLYDWENAVLSLCVKHGIALEISGLWRAPNMEMLRRGKAMGVTFSMGSDCHTPLQVGVLDYPIQAAEELGLTETDMFLPIRRLE